MINPVIYVVSRLRILHIIIWSNLDVYTTNSHGPIGPWTCNDQIRALLRAHYTISHVDAITGFASRIAGVSW